MLKRYLPLVAIVLFLLPVISFAAEGIAATVNGKSMFKKGGEDWRSMKEGDALQEGVTVWIGASSSVVLKVGNELVELSGGPTGNEITVVRFSPFEVVIKGAGIRYLGAPKPPDPQLPSAPMLLSPQNGFRAAGKGVELAWSASEKESLYHIQISAIPDFSKIIIDKKGSNPNWRAEKLDAGIFYWRVSAINKDDIEGRFSETWTFEIKPLPEPPSLSPPASTKTSTTFRWKRGSEADRYHLQISKDKNFSEIAVDLDSVEGPRITVGALEEGDYFVRLSTIDEGGLEGIFSEPQPFYVGPKVASSNTATLMIMFGVAFILLGTP